MNSIKKWNSYVMDTLPPKRLDEIIIKLGCPISGCRLTTKGLRNIPKSRKISALTKKPDSDKEFMKTVEEMLQNAKEAEESKVFLALSAKELIQQKDALNDQDTDKRLAILNHFFLAPTTLEAEKKELLEIFAQSGANNEEEEVAITIQPSSHKVKKMQQPLIQGKPQAKEGGLSRKEQKDYRILQSMHEELKAKKEEQDKQLAKLQKHTQQLEAKLEEQKKQYTEEIKALKEKLREKEQKLKEVKDEKGQLEVIVQKNRKPYLFIGTDFTKGKVQQVKARKKAYDNIDICYLTAKQWLEGPKKVEEEVTEVYGFDYDIEATVKEKIIATYGYKAKFFAKDYHFYEYVQQCWEV